MKVGILTSSRADYGIYRPLLKKLEADPFFELELIVFGTHLSHFYGYTVQRIREDDFDIAHRVESLVLGDSEEAIATAMALTSAKFSGLWALVQQKYDMIFCLGDRYEMFAAVSAAVPFNLKFAHIHGGEETRGAIDNMFRHSITQMSAYHFTTTRQHKKRVLQLLGANDDNDSGHNVINTGALSLDNIKEIPLYDESTFSDKYNIDISKPTILFTFHPETVRPQKNEKFIIEILRSLEALVANYQIVVTMPNNDTKASSIRMHLQSFSEKHKNRVLLIESFGTKGYFSCMSYCRLVMGNSSSGIIEAASFGKYVINLGDRQKGRISGENVIHTDITKADILSSVKRIEGKPEYTAGNPYWNGGAADQIIECLKKNFNSE